ncbi:MAG: hypothetical protein ACI9W4_000197 [Rhodothermales bacterium]|jgi:hypothetical protein
MDWIEKQTRALEAMAGDITAEFSSLSAETADYKLDANTWSINECFDHLMESNRKYYDLFESLHDGTYRRASLSRIPLLSRWLGRLVVRVVSPDYNGRSRTSHKLYPRQLRYGRNLADDLVEENQVLIDQIRRCAGHDLDRVVASPINNLVAYSLGDCIRILVDHEARHIGQARNVKAGLARA